MKHFKTFMLVSLLTAFMSAAFAQSNLDPTFTAGTGTNESYMVVDFQDGTSQPSFLFGYKYDGTKTGLDMVEALSAYDAPAVGYVPGYGPGTTSSLGPAIESFAFLGHSQAGFDINAYWGYYTKDAGVWDYAPTGFSTRTLFNGSYDGWSFSNGTDPLPRDPGAPVPEGNSALLLGFGMAGLALTAAKRCKRAA